MRNPHEIGTGRRGLIKGMGLVLLAVQVLPSIARAKEDSSGDGAGAAGNLLIRSGQGFVPHTHDLWIPYALLSAPPAAGVKLTSTPSRGHTHPVALSRDDLASVNRGGTVTVKARAVRHPDTVGPVRRTGA
jgi:hypothetical protein